MDKSNKKKNIAVFVKNLTSGGAEKQAVLLAKTLQNDYDVHFIVFNASKVHQKYLDMLENTDVIIKMLEGGHMKRFANFYRYLRNHRVNLLFSYLTAANLYACIIGLLTNVKIITGIRNVNLPTRKRFVEKLLTNYIAQNTVVNCFSGKENFVDHGFRSSKMIVIPNGFYVDCQSTETIPNNMITIITVGRFHPQKDYETAIKSFAALNNTIKNTQYYIIGYGEEERKIRSLIRDLNLDDKVRVFINPDNITSLYYNSDIYLSTSLVEGTSNSIMEAMNAKLPIIATNVGDNSYLIDNGKSGYVLPIKDVNGIADKLLLLSQNSSLRHDMGKRGKQILTEKYSVKSFRKNYVNLINSLI